MSKNVITALMATEERTGEGRKVFASLERSMDFRYSKPGTSVAMMPANSKGMQITPADSAQEMDLISPSVYPSVNIQPVPGYRQQEILLPLSPLTYNPMLSSTGS